MESWSSPPEGKGVFFSDDLEFPIDSFSRDKKALMGWDSKVSFNFKNIGSSREAVESMELLEFELPEMMRKHFHCSSTMEVIGDDVGNDCNKRIASPTCLITSNLSLGEEESGSMVSSSFMDSNSQDSSLIALKLGSLADLDCKGLQNRKLSEDVPDLSSVNPPLLSKKARIKGSYSQTPFCQVLGCNMDLSTSKDYHKRHKVCDVHSKTAKVIVNGIEQRFCQQCSRFHLLAEFDDGKRSCRRRLAGHNERRRKPQLDTLPGRQNKFLQSFQGTSFMGSSLKGTFVFSDTFPGATLYPEEYVPANQRRHFEFNEESNYWPQLTMPILSRQLLPKSFLNLYGGAKHCDRLHSSASEDCIRLDTESTTQKQSGALNSSGALSLLSAQSQEFSSNLSKIPLASPQIIQRDFTNHSIALKAKSMEKYGQIGFACGMNTGDVNQMGSFSVTSANNFIDLKVHSGRVCPEIDYLKAKYSLSSERGPTVDLFQLSSHLQRVERQKFCPNAGK